MKHIWIFILIFAFVISLNSCGSNGGDGNTVPDNGTQDYSASKAMFFLVSDDNEFIAGAMIGNSEITDGEGVAAGDMEKSASGWVKAEALGYATCYAASDGVYGETEIYQAWMTPYQDQVCLKAGDSQTLFSGDVDAGDLEVAVAGTDFSETPVHVGVAVIDPATVGPLFEDLDNDDDVYLHQAFAVDGMMDDGTAASLAGGKKLTVVIRDSRGTADAPTLAWFDPESGTWKVMAGACTRSGDDLLTCTLDRLSPLFGLFLPEEPDYLTRSVAAERAAKADTDSDYGDAYRDARNRLRHRFNELAGGNDGIDTTDSELNEALEDMAEAARVNAIKNPNENGKKGLLAAAQQAHLLGNITLGDSLVADAKKLTREMGEALLNADCLRCKEVMHVAEQNMFFGNEDMAEQLLDKFKNDLKECDVWSGTIQVVLYLADPHPAPAIADEMPLRSRSGFWTETHAVLMRTNPLTYVMTGEDTVTINFPRVKYQADDECEQSLTYQGQGSLVLKFDGTYDGYSFHIGDFSLEYGSSPVNIAFTQYAESESDDQCIPIDLFCKTYQIPHYSLIVHGFSSASPPITLQEMLPEDVDALAFNGSEDIVNPTPELGTYPVNTGSVSWRFNHIQKILPVEE